jgi:hypothetical protein
MIAVKNLQKQTRTCATVRRVLGLAGASRFDDQVHNPGSMPSTWLFAA